MKNFLPFIFILPFVNLRVDAQCNAAFTYTISQSNAQFQAGNTGPHLLHYWRFGDGTFTLGANTSHNYSAPGIYMVSHGVIDSLGACADSVIEAITLNFTVGCTATFIATRDSAHFNWYYFHSTSQSSGGSIQSYNWTINGTTITTTPAFYYVFSPGSYNVCLSIGTSAGCTSSVCQTIAINESSNCGWSASFTHTASASNPKQVSFFPTPSLNTLMYYWSFGDGYSSSQKNPVHTYAQTGTYNIILAIADTSTGCIDSTGQTMQVQGSPADSCTASFTHAIADPSHPNQLTFTATSNQTITSQTWRINQWSNPYDSVFLNTFNPTYTFTDTGYYYVCLYITTNTGCARSYCEGIYIDSIGGRQGRTIPSYPNPAANIVSLRVSLAEENGIAVTVYNLSGNIVYQTQIHGNAGSNEINIPVQQLNAGQYFIDLHYGNKHSRSVFQKF